MTTYVLFAWLSLMMDCCVLHNVFFVIMYIFVYMLFCRGPQGKLVRQLSHPLKMKSLLTYLLMSLTTLSFLRGCLGWDMGLNCVSC